MARCACFMMQKNETLLLEPWILYHAFLFGIENCFVYDNGSDQAICKEVLLRYERLGLNVDRSRTGEDAFIHKGNIFTTHIQQLQAQGAYDFYFPLDCDEFVIIAGQNGFSSSRSEIHDYLDSRSASNRAMNVSHQLINIPGRMDLFALTGFSKSIAPKDGLLGMDHGFHTIQLADNSQPVRTRILYAHLHNKPYDFIVESARLKLKPFVDCDDLEALRNFTGAGNHLLRYLLGSSETYHQSYASTKRLGFADLMLWLEAFRQVDLLRIWRMGDDPAYEPFKEPNCFPERQIAQAAHDTGSSDTPGDHETALVDMLLAS